MPKTKGTTTGSTTSSKSTKTPPSSSTNPLLNNTVVTNLVTGAKNTGAKVEDKTTTGLDKVKGVVDHHTNSRTKDETFHAKGGTVKGFDQAEGMATVDPRSDALNRFDELEDLLFRKDAKGGPKLRTGTLDLFGCAYTRPRPQPDRRHGPALQRPQPAGRDPDARLGEGMTRAVRRPAALVLVAALALGVGAGPAAGGTLAAGPTIAQLIGQKLVVAMDGTTTPSASLLDRITKGQVGGVILFGRNITTKAALVALAKQLHDAAVKAGRPRLLIMVDQEGGSIKRIPWAPPTLSPPQMGARASTATARSQGSQTGSALCVARDRRRPGTGR